MTSSRKTSSIVRWITFVSVTVLVALSGIWALRKLRGHDSGPLAHGAVASATTAAASRGLNGGASTDPVQPHYLSSPIPLHARPLPVAQETASYQWTSANAMDTNVIRILAETESAYERMVNENNTIFRRQLVYHKGAFSLLAQKSRLGNSVSELTLPGLDGQELQVEILKADFEAGGDRGTFTGRVAGQPDSMVVVAFSGANEGFTVISPHDHTFLQAEPREAGELVVKSIDPAKYGGNLKGCGVN